MSLFSGSIRSKHDTIEIQRKNREKIERKQRENREKIKREQRENRERPYQETRK